MLIADDEPAARRGVRQLLAAFPDFTVAGECRDGAEVLTALDTLNPHVVCLDIQMPGIDGPSFALALRKGLRHVPLVILTGVDDPKHEADRCNAEAFLSKPFNAPELVKVVRRFAT